MEERGGGGRRPTAAEVAGRLKDDGDFDALRRTIIRKVKHNEELRNSIITEVKQSLVLNEDGSEKLKLRELSDAIYQEIGSKIMGQISDEVWKVIKSNETDIRGTVEAVYNRIVNPEEPKEVEPSPSKKLRRKGKEGHVSLVKPSTSITIKTEEDEPEEPPGFALGDHEHSNGNIQQQQQPSVAEEHDQLQSDDAAPPGFGSLGNAGDEDPDVPPGFG